MAFDLSHLTDAELDELFVSKFKERYIEVFVKPEPEPVTVPNDVGMVYQLNKNMICLVL